MSQNTATLYEQHNSDTRVCQPAIDIDTSSDREIEVLPLERALTNRGFVPAWHYALRYWTPLLGAEALHCWNVIRSFCTGTGGDVHERLTLGLLCALRS